MSESDGLRQTDADAADAFAERAQAERGDSIRHLVAFGSAVRGDDRGVHAEVDVLLVLEETDCERALRALAREVGLEHGTVFTVHVLPADRFETREDHPFVRRVFEEGRAYV